MWIMWTMWIVITGIICIVLGFYLGTKSSSKTWAEFILKDLDLSTINSPEEFVAAFEKLRRKIIIEKYM